ncbi:MAG: thermonuclease family protein [Cyanobacteriota bacterium]|nr:thermonuclease family protein [Cyanobacteriota bacterium]
MGGPIAWLPAAGPDRQRRTWAGVAGLGVLLWSGAAAAATVVSIDSGDTLRVRDGGWMRTIRLACLEAPELEQAPHGAKAKATLQRLLPVGTTVSLISLGRPGTTTAMAEVISGAGPVNLQMVRNGLAFGAMAEQPQCDPLRYAEAENFARFYRLGVWQVEGGIQRPRDWRIARAQAEADRARAQRVQQQLARERAERAAWRDAEARSSPTPLPTGLAARARALPPGSQQLCVAITRKQFMLSSQGIPPPPGTLENLCACLSKPKANETAQGIGERCASQFLQRLTKAL